jgi:hypothetical protein
VGVANGPRSAQSAGEVIPCGRSSILFRCSNQIFAISSASVQEVRSVDSLAGAACEVNESTISKVRHALRRGDRSIYVVNTALHFGLKPSPPALIFLLRKSRVALLIDGIEKATMTRLGASGCALPGDGIAV